MLSNTMRLYFSYLTIIHIFLLTLQSKIIGDILRYKQKSKVLLIHEITQLIIMKMKIKTKNRSHRYGKNRPRFRHGHKYRT